MTTTAKKKPAAKPAAKPTIKSMKKPATKNTTASNEIVMIPLSKLVISEKNTRKNDDMPRDIGGLVATLRAEGGVLHNLIVHEQLDAKQKPTGKYAVDDGEGRRLSMLELVALGEFSKDHPMPCKIVAAERALASSLAANFHRKDMHPADQFAAFQQLLEEGKSITEIAVAFGLPEKDVKQRLKLANVSKKLTALYRKGGIKLEQMMALAITDDHKAQERVWEATGHNSSPNRIRSMLTGEEVKSSEDDRALFVGMEAYQAEGGIARQDLFSDTDEFYLADSALLEQLAQRKLIDIAESIKPEGHAWVLVRTSLDFGEYHSFNKAKTEGGIANKKQAAHIKQLEARIDALEEARDALDEEEKYDESAIIDPQIEAVKDELREFKETILSVTAKDAPRAGAIVTIGPNGRPSIYRHLIRPEDIKANSKTKGKPSADSNNKSAPGTDTAPAEEHGHSNAMTLRLMAHKSAGLQICMAHRPSIALAAITAQLAADIFQNRGDRILNISARGTDMRKYDAMINDSRALKDLAALRTELTHDVPADAQEDVLLLTKWLLNQAQEVVLKILAVCVAQNLDAGLPNSQLGNSRGDEISHLLGLDMREWWQADVESYFSWVSKPLMLAAVTEASGEEAARQVAELKKAQPRAALATQKLTGTGWLPEILRTAEVTQ